LDGSGLDEAIVISGRAEGADTDTVNTFHIDAQILITVSPVLAAALQKNANH
jgi:hypothetical protein